MGQFFHSAAKHLQLQQFQLQKKKLDPEATSRFCSKRVVPNIQQTENITSNLTPRKLKKVDAYKIWIRILLVSL
jgi:hypothetical protein